MDTERQQQVGKWGLNEITINIVRCNHGASKFSYSVSYITFNCFNIIIIHECSYDIWGVTKVWLIIIGAMVLSVMKDIQQQESEESKVQRF